MYETAVHHTNIRTPDPGRDGGVQAVGLGKRYGDLWALRDLDLDVAPGTVLGLLGHNGAGKTTAIRILTTLAQPTTGSATVAGYDVGRDPGEVRMRVGVAAQQATVDGLMTARANLEMVGRLHRMPKQEARRQAGELLERLDLAASIVASPEVLFLDEPTTGLDPRSRNDLWDLLRSLVRDGTTVILTTQYLEEADRLADDIVVLDHGRAVATGTPGELKARIGNDRIDVKVAAPSELVAAAGAISEFVSSEPTFDSDLLVVTAPVRTGTRLIDVVRALDEAGIDAVDLNRRQASLDDVFLTLTAPGELSPSQSSPSHQMSAEASR
jgi:ABC-2 type transport system ATP-binding protein